MHPVLSDFRRFLWYTAVWLLTGVFMAMLLVLAELAGWTSALLFAVPVTLTFGFLAASAYFVGRSLPLSRRPFFLAIALFGSASLIAGLLWLGICTVWQQMLLVIVDVPGALQMSSHLSTVLLATGFSLYLLSLLAYDVLTAFENVHLAERREAALRLQAREAELQLLRSQIDPHFLFNSLNSISALTTIDPSGARDMTLALADFFRQTLALSEKKKISLAQEIQLCEHFLAIEKIRFGKKLQVDMQLASDSLSALIPPMILQPLLENAIKHGIRNMSNAGLVTLKIVLQDQWIYISIQNPIDAESPENERNGVGLQNLRQRLATVYDGKARVTWIKSTHDFLIEITLPLELE